MKLKEDEARTKEEQSHQVLLAEREKLQQEMKLKEDEARTKAEQSHQELLAEREKAEIRLKEALEAEIKARELEQEEKTRLQMESWAAEQQRMEMVCVLFFVTQAMGMNPGGDGPWCINLRCLRLYPELDAC